MKTLHTYIIGFTLSIMLTLVAFLLVWQHELSGRIFPSHEVAVPILIVLALIQLAVQLVFFLHITQEKAPRWNFIAFAFALFIVAILVGGTLWIMNNLDHMQMSAEEIFKDEAITPHEH